MSAEITSKSIIFRAGQESAGHELPRLIREEIGGSGPITFARFMSLALYHPEYGYYEKGLRQTGRAGDFYTSVSVGSLYGELLGLELAHRLERLPGNVLLVEAAAHTGELARDILTYLKQYHPGLYERLGYVILEPSRFRQNAQEKILAPFDGKVAWHQSWHDLTEFSGIAFCNELLDALPMHVVRWSAKEHGWREFGVGVEGGKFCWIPLPAITPGVDRFLPEIPPPLQAVFPDGFTFEVNAAAFHWWMDAARALKKGWLFTADYGLREEDLLAPHRSAGTLRAYHRHQVNSNVLERAGDQDITAHVNFSRIIQAGETAGLKTETLIEQGFFLKTIIEKADARPELFPFWTPMRYRQVASLVHPEHLGRSFKILIQGRTPED